MHCTAALGCHLPGNGKEHSEELRWEAQRPVDQPRVKVHVRVQLAADEVVIRQGGVLKRTRDEARVQETERVLANRTLPAHQRLGTKART